MCLPPSLVHLILRRQRDCELDTSRRPPTNKRPPRESGNGACFDAATRSADGNLADSNNRCVSPTVRQCEKTPAIRRTRHTDPAAAATTRLAAYQGGTKMSVRHGYIKQIESRELNNSSANNNRKQVHVLIHTENHFKKLNVLKVDDYVKYLFQKYNDICKL